MAGISADNVRLSRRRESTFGTAATGNYVGIPFKSWTLGIAQAWESDDILGQGRDAQRPARAAPTLRGEVVVPGDLRAIGYWLALMFGAPTTSNASSVYTHVFKSGAQSLPSDSFQKHHPDGGPLFELFTGVMVDEMTFDISPTGSFDVKMNVLAKNFSDGATNNGGTVTDVQVDRFNQYQSSLSKDGAAFARATQAAITIKNGLDPQYFIGGAGNIGDIDLGHVGVEGNVTLRYTDGTMFNIAKNETLFAWSASWTRSASQKLTITVEQCEASQTGRSITGPGGMQAQFDLRGSKDPTAGRSITATLINDVTSYAA